MTILMRFVPSNSMKIDLLPEQEAYLSTKDTICQVIRENPDSVFAFDILQDEIDEVNENLYF